MFAFVSKAFADWGWGTEAQFQKHIQNTQSTLDRELALIKNPKLRAAKISENKEEIQQLKRERKPQDFDLENLHWRQILMGIFNSTDGNYPQVVTIHGGYVYDANEVNAKVLFTVFETANKGYENRRISL